jgi:hypothetical protein
MSSISEEMRHFESIKDDLLRSSPGGYALLCGRKLIGIYPSVDEALLAASQVFDQGRVAPGAQILINEITTKVAVRVMATPYQRRRSSAAA